MTCSTRRAICRRFSSRAAGGSVSSAESQSVLRRELQESFRAVLGEAGWGISEDPADSDRQSLLFTYPLGLEENLYGLGNYARPVVRLEFGCRGDVWPSERQRVQPYIADALPDLLAKPTAGVHVLRPERTFREKATLLHAVSHSGKMPPRLSRQRANTNAIQLTVITHEIEATERLSAAQIEGAEAARRAGLETKYQAMQLEGSAPENIAATRREDELLHQQKITEEVLKTANADRDRLREIDREEAKAMVLVGSAADQLGIMLKLRDLENERLTIIARELLGVGTLRDGFKAFFTEMEKEAEKPGKILFDGMNSAVNALSDNLSKLLTRQKTGWASMFKSIGTGMLKSSLDAVIHKGLGALGLGGGKPDGTSEPKALWVRIGKALGLPGSKGLPGAGAAGQVAGALGVGGGRRDGQSTATAFYVVSVTEGGGGSSAGGLGSLAALFGGCGSCRRGRRRGRGGNRGGFVDYFPRRGRRHVGGQILHRRRRRARDPE